MCCPCRHGTWAPWRRARHTRQGFWSFWSTLLAFLVASPGWYFYAAVRTHVHISTTVAIYTQYCTYTPMGHNCSAPAVGLPPCDSVNAVIAAHLGAGSWPWTRTAWYVVAPGVVCARRRGCNGGAGRGLWQSAGLRVDGGRASRLATTIRDGMSIVTAAALLVAWAP